MFKNTSQKKTISKVMLLGGVCNSGDMEDHNGWKVDLLLPVYQINEALIHRICHVAPLTPGNDVLDHKQENQLV